MKRLFSSFLTLVMLLTLSAPAYADVMWEPNSNYFYDTHRDQCEYENRGYYANGKEGFITLWDAPNGGTVRAQFQNGERMWVYYIYRDRWALTAYWTDGEETSGWVPLADLYLIYDHISFEEEYGDQFRDYQGEFASFDGEPGSYIQLWEYPGAWDEKETLELTPEFLDALRGTEEQPSYISKIYTDEHGANWGYVAYMYGLRNFWICLDNPSCIMSSCIPLTGSLIESGELIAPKEPVLPAVSYTPYILVAAVAAVTGGLLFFFYGKRRKTTK